MKKIFKTTSLKANIAANFIGNTWGNIISLIFVPFYIHYIGAEGYGLLGIFASIQVVLSLLDSGLSTTLNKELARLSVIKGAARQTRNLVRTLETVYWIIALIVGVSAIALSPLIAHYWVQPKALSTTTVQNAFMLLGAGLFFQLPIGFYSGGLLGLQRHVILNGIRIFFSTFRSVGGLLVLMFYSSTVTAFFTWTLLVAMLQAVTIVWTVWYYLPRDSNKPVFDKNELKRIWRFAAGMSGIAVTAVLLTQLDKVILSKILLLEQFGYYSIAASLCMLIYQITGPIGQSFFPKFSSLISEGNEPALKRTYHLGCQLMSVFVFPSALMLIIFSRELLMIWINDPVAVENMWQIASVFAIGSALNGLMQIPYMLTLSYSYTKLPLYTNLILLGAMIPAISFAAIYFGAIGGAASWAILNGIYFFITPHLVHKRLLKGEIMEWYWHDTIKPLLVALSFFLICRLLLPLHQLSRGGLLVVLIVIGISAIALSIMAAKSLKNPAIRFIMKIRFLKAKA